MPPERRPGVAAVSRRRRLLWGGVAAAVLLAAAVFVLRDPGDPAGTAKPASSAPVSTATVTSGDVPIELEGLGRVQAFNTVTVRAQVGGQVDKVDFEDGQAVQPGKLLAQIDPRPLQATIAQDRAMIDRDRASLANAETDLRRYVPLAGQGIVSAQQVATQRSLVAQLHGTVAADTAVLDRDQVQLGYTSITAPIAGVLGLRQVDAGNTVSPADPGGLVVLTQIQPIIVLLPVAQSSLPEVQLRQTASGAAGLVVQAWTQDGARQLDQGRLAALSNQVDVASGTVTLKAVFPNPGRTLWPGASVTARLVLDVQHAGLTLPGSAVDQGPQGSFVWVLAGDGTVSPAPVQVAQVVHGTALVTGVKAGEQVVTDGQYGLTPGTHVAVQQPTPRSSAAAAPQPLRSNQPNRLGISP